VIHAAGIALLLFCAIGTFDGLYYHLFKFELHRVPEAAWEQKLHTARAFLFVPVGLLLYARNFGGALLWLGVAFVAADFVVELLDVAAERQSRRKLGGISSGEYMVHIAGTSARMVSLALVLAAKPASAWGFSGEALPAYPGWLTAFAFGYSAVMLGGAILYVALSRWPVRLALPRICSGLPHPSPLP
jgi:hypothetical protein